MSKQSIIYDIINLKAKIEDLNQKNPIVQGHAIHIDEYTEKLKLQTLEQLEMEMSNLGEPSDGELQAERIDPRRFWDQYYATKAFIARNKESTQANLDLLHKYIRA